jgi:hypothetical protein
MLPPLFRDYNNLLIVQVASATPAQADEPIAPQ